MPMAMTAEKVTWQYRQQGIYIPVQFSMSYKVQLTRSRLSGNKNLFPRIDEHHLLHAWCFFSLLQAKTCNSRFHASKL